MTTILALVRYYLPGQKSGGPVRSIANLVERLGDEFEFRIVASDRDSLDAAPYSGVLANRWNRVGKGWVYYIAPENQSLVALANLITVTKHDVLYLNSFFDPMFTQRPLWARRLGLVRCKPIVIAPRGEFSRGALFLKKWRKETFRYFAAGIGLYRDLIWHASTEREEKEIRNALLGRYRMGSQIVVASDLMPPANGAPLRVDEMTRKRGDMLRIVFVSRITPKKNLDFTLRVLAKVQCRVRFDIFGPIGDEMYWRQCRKLIARLPENVLAQYKGIVDHSAIVDVFGSYDLFVFPTRGENFGHVIVESLSAGTPVLIANTTPWRNLENAGVGWDLALECEQVFVDKIEVAATIEKEDYVLWRKRARSYSQQQSSSTEAIASNRELFLKAASQV